MQQIRNEENNKKASKFGSLFIWKSKMVRERNTFWHHVTVSLLIINAKLTKLGFKYYDGIITYPDALNEFEDSG
jgi:hypothetical protein